MCTYLESPKYSVSTASNRQRFWAVLLAGGDGTRLQSLTLKIAGDSRPKQFCRLFGGKSLLTQTEERLEPLFRHDRTLFVVTRDHERYYREDLGRAVPSRIIVQPQNRGTGVAIATALFHILQREANPFVAFFPCDHYYSNDDAFVSTIGSAMACAQEYPKSIILVGAEAHYPEIEYGWIEPGFVIRASGAMQLLRVNRFWEKPSLSQARALMSGGCLWNTFVTVGRASTFLDLLRSQIPDVMLDIASGVSRDELDGVYRGVRPIDFSREVLTLMPHRLLAVRDVESGWADLGNPTRVIDTLVRGRVEPAWLREMQALEKKSSG
jgi:mannose-1-phosphate guanylyltransferase